MLAKIPRLGRRAHHTSRAQLAIPRENLKFEHSLQSVVSHPGGKGVIGHEKGWTDDLNGSFRTYTFMYHLLH